MPPSSVESLAGWPTDPNFSIRDWLLQNNRKQLAFWDKFLTELRLRRLHPLFEATEDRRAIVRKTVEVLRHLLGAIKWKSAAHILIFLRGLGRELHAAGGYREPAVSNVFRRVMAVVREECLRADDNSLSAIYKNAAEPSSRLSLQSMLWALPQHVKTTSKLAIRGDHQRQESFASEADFQAYPPSYYVDRPDLKSSIMEAITEIVSELEDLYKSISDEATNHIQADEIILTCGGSKTVEVFLKAAAVKKRSFQVLVCEGPPPHSGHCLAETLAEAGIESIVIPDAAIFAVMPRVNKVLLPAHAVLANGGLIARSGCSLMALAAHHNSVPTVCVAGIFKLCPIFPHEGQDTLNDLVSPSCVLDFAHLSDVDMKDVEIINPLHDYIKPEYISLYVTNVGSFQPSFIYRLLAEYYHADDWDAFE